MICTLKMAYYNHPWNKFIKSSIWSKIGDTIFKSQLSKQSQTYSLLYKSSYLNPRTFAWIVHLLHLQFNNIKQYEPIGMLFVVAFLFYAYHLNNTPASRLIFLKDHMHLEGRSKLKPNSTTYESPCENEQMVNRFLARLQRNNQLTINQHIVIRSSIVNFSQTMHSKCLYRGMFSYCTLLRLTSRNGSQQARISSLLSSCTSAI